MATIAVPMIAVPEATVSLFQDTLALTWTGVQIIATAPVRVYGLAAGLSFSQTLAPGTQTIMFAITVLLVAIGPVLGADGSGLAPATPFAIGAGSP